MVNIDTGHDPVAFCVLSPDAKVLLSMLDDGQLETWSTENGGMTASDTSDISDVTGGVCVGGVRWVACID